MRNGGGSKRWERIWRDSLRGWVVWEDVGGESGVGKEEREKLGEKSDRGKVLPARGGNCWVKVEKANGGEDGGRAGRWFGGGIGRAEANREE